MSDMGKWIFVALLCLAGTAMQSQGHKALSEKEVAKITADGGTNYQHVALYSCVDLSSVKEGDAVKVGVYFSIDDGWNIYDNNPDAHGYLPTKVDWRLPEGCELEKVEWQQPVRLFENMDKMGYFRGCFVVATIRVKELPGATLDIAANCEWQMCDELHCIQKKGRVTVNVNCGETKKTAFYKMLSKW